MYIRTQAATFLPGSKVHVHICTCGNNRLTSPQPDIVEWIETWDTKWLLQQSESYLNFIYPMWEGVGAASVFLKSQLHCVDRIWLHTWYFYHSSSLICRLWSDRSIEKCSAVQYACSVLCIVVQCSSYNGSPTCHRWRQNHVAGNHVERDIWSCYRVWAQIWRGMCTD